MPQIYDMGPALLPLRRKACWGIFRPKNPTASAGFEPANLGTKGQHATPRPPKPICMYICVHIILCTYPSMGKRLFWLWSPQSVLCNGHRKFFPVVKGPRHEIHHSRPPSAEAKNYSSQDSTPPVSFLGVDMDNFFLFYIYSQDIHVYYFAHKQKQTDSLLTP